MENLNKNDIIKIIETSKLDKTKFWLGCGASLVMYGILLDTHDIDCGCDKGYFKKLSKNYKVEKAPMGGNMISINNFLDLFEEEKPNKLIKINEIQIETLEDIKKFYKRRGRTKDKIKLELIKEYERNNK